MDRESKRPLLEQLLRGQASATTGKLTIVFSRTKHGANKLAKSLCDAGFPADAIHGNKSQAQREKALEKFKKGLTPVLVATDVAARGVDVKDVGLVVNFDLPNEPEAYVHRIGRTGRAGAEGRAVSFCAEDEREFLREIEKVIKMAVPRWDDHAVARRSVWPIAISACGPAAAWSKAVETAVAKAAVAETVAADGGGNGGGGWITATLRAATTVVVRRPAESVAAITGRREILPFQEAWGFPRREVPFLFAPISNTYWQPTI